MQASYQQFWCFALPGGQQYAPKVGKKPAVLRRTLRHVGGQLIVLAFVLFDIGALALAATASVWLMPWVTTNLAVLVLGTLSWTEDRRIQSESATATQRQAEKVRTAERKSIEEQQRAAKRQHQAELLRQAELASERDAQRRLQAALLQAEGHVREAEQRRQQEEREMRRREQAEQAERLRQAEQQRREAEQRRRQAEKEREATRRRRREREWTATRIQMDWWTVLGVAPSASKAEIVRNYRRKIKQCHPDRLVGLAPELLQLAEEQTKALNGAYENALRTCG